MSPETLLWAAFGVLVLGALAIDLGLFQRKAHVVHTREALVWTLVWIFLGLAFAGLLWVLRDGEAALLYLTGYLIEKSLSVDNLFVFLVIFAYFKVPAEFESRVLYWGVFGALVMRAGFILGGVALIENFAWTMYVFGGILILTGLKLLVKKDEGIDPDRNPVVRLFRKCFRVSERYDGAKFFTRVDGRLAATPLFIVVLVVESTDVVFAVDSVPAILGITTDRMIVYTSNVFAILGLRALYFLLARMMALFRFLKYGLVVILVFVGVKMLLHTAWHVPVLLSLSVILGTLVLSVGLSLAFPPRPKPEEEAEPAAAKEEG